MPGGCADKTPSMSISENIYDALFMRVSRSVAGSWAIHSHAKGLMVKARAWGMAMMFLAIACLAVQRRAAVRAELLARGVSLDAADRAQPTNWWFAQVVSSSAAQVKK